MALTTNPWDATALVAYINEIWPGPTNEEFFAGAVAANFFMDLSPYAQNGGDIIHIPNVFTNVFTVNSQSTQGAEITTGDATVVDDTLTINTHKYIATLLGDKDAQQIASVYNLNEIYARKAGGTMVEDLEAAIFALQSSVSTNTVNDTASVINDTDLRGAVEKLDSADTPLSECAWFFHPLKAGGCKILSNWLGNLYEITRRKAKATVNDLTRELVYARCESLNSMAT